ncbi:DUF805 domain-containing protein [Brevundimonas goettingensis]|uniref:DUF805 domain-containing protein n=1 Tax=Brevundimonas goettingensis TaxID=2774190 RepID=A0A975C2V4_9CAUL|nr:hypothetical protein [Brevundimonas goettingensis]QTC90840.1 hypothetical protein IFJ75_16670 [Brevundimonas goettingensis]
MGWIRTLGNRLGYGGRSDRREFLAGAALTVIAPYALSLAIKGSVARLFAAFPRTVALGLALILTLLVCAAIIAWFWGWSALLTRRARDVGAPAWSGLAGLFALWAAMTAVKGFADPGVYGWTNVLACLAFAVVWAVWPSRGGSWAPGRPGGAPSAEPA